MPCWRPSYTLPAASCWLSICFGYVRGHYPQRFVLDDDQRTLILQTMLFFFWLAAGAGIYTRLEGWSYSNALTCRRGTYAVDASIDRKVKRQRRQSVLTVGFGDIYPTTNAGRGFLIVFELIGITPLGLFICSISRFVRDISANKIIKSHELHSHKSTLGRTVTNEKELRDRLGLPPTSIAPPGAAATATPGTKAPTDNNAVLDPGVKDSSTAATTAISFGPDRRPGFARASTTATVPHIPAAHQDPENRYGHIEIIGNTVTYHEHTATVIVGGRGGAARRVTINRDDLDDMDSPTSRWPWKWRQRRRQQQKKLLRLREEKDRFNAMRAIQEETRRFKQYYALAMAVLAFGLLWFMGALVFMFSEERLQGLNYFEALYFGFVALLTIGYGDLSPKSNAGKAFLIVWSLIAVPTMTILIQELGATVVGTVNRGTFKLADWTAMPKKGLAKTFVANLRMWFWAMVAGHKRRLTQYGDQKRKQQSGQDAAAAAAEAEAAEKAAAVAREKRDIELYDETNVHQLARQLASAIRDVAHDLGAEPPKRYNFEEWAHFAELIRFSRRREGKRAGEKPSEQAGEEAGEEDEGLIEWDWIGEDSPMLADTTEAQWVLDRLCESLNRYTRQQARRQKSLEKQRAVNESANLKVDSSAPPASSSASSSVSSSPAKESPAC